MNMCGYFGKRPADRDFVFEGLPTRVTEVWADRISSWLIGLRAAAPETWRGSYYAAPLWRFAVAANHLTDQAWIGLMAASADEMGRAFPFAVLMSMQANAFGKEVVFQIDEVMDALELDVLDFLAGDTNRGKFLSRIAVGSADIRSALDHKNGEVLASIPELSGGEAGLCTPWSDLAAPDGAERHILVWDRTHDMPHPAAPGYWWHEGCADRVAEYCVFGGMPEADAAVGMFLGNWNKFGWRPRG